MKTMYLLSIFWLLSACHPVRSTPDQQQTFICKSLIDGYLQAQHLGQFRLWSLKKQNESKQLFQYTYRQPTVGGMVLGIPQQVEMKFNCRQKLNQHYVVEWFDTENKNLHQILNVILPYQEFKDNLPAYGQEIR